MGSGGFPPDDGLAEWVATLRVRLDRGDLKTLAPVDIGHGSNDVPVAHLVRIMLADLESYDNMAPAEANNPVNLARRHGLLGDFRVLRLLIG
jgi:hypothetical protein